MRSADVHSAARTPIQHAAEQWTGFCQRFSKDTRDNYLHYVSEFLLYGNFVFISDITYQSIQTYINSLLNHHKNSSINTILIAIQSFCHWLSDMYNIPNPANQIRHLPDDAEEARCLSREEYQSILAVAQGDDLYLIQFLAHTGLRVSELISLKESNRKGHWLIFCGKGRKIRHVPLNQIAQEAFPHILYLSKSARTIRRHCHQLAARAGIPPFGPHACRHYFATQLLAKGVPIHHVSKLLGHSSVLITEKIYYHFRPDHLAGLTDCLE